MQEKFMMQLLLRLLRNKVQLYLLETSCEPVICSTIPHFIITIFKVRSDNKQSKLATYKSSTDVI